MAKEPPTYNDLVQGGMKAAMKTASATSGDLWMVPREAIHVLDGFNVRQRETKDYKEHVEALARSIEANGWMRDKPLAAFVAKEDGKDVIYTTDGHSRLAAYDLLVARGVDLGNIPVVVKPAGTTREDLTVALITSNAGKPLTPFETGTVIKRLASYGWSEKDIAKKVGFTAKYVSDLLMLVGAPAAIRNIVSSGKMAATLAVQMMREHGGDAVAKIKEAVSTAEASGKEKATKKHAKAAEAPRVRRASDADFLRSAIRYAVSVAADDVIAAAWLANFESGDELVIRQLEGFMGQPAGAWKDKKLRTDALPPSVPPSGDTDMSDI